MSGVTKSRAELIAQFKREIREKTYKVKSEQIAEKMTLALREEEKSSTATLPQKNRWTG